MKRIWLMGGLGNVLFQILAYNVVKKKATGNIKFVTYLTTENPITKAIKWSIHDTLYTNFIAKEDTVSVGFINALPAVIMGILSKSLNVFFKYSTFYIKKINLDNSPLASNIFGYFQDKAFLSYHRTEILELGDKIRNKAGVLVNQITVVHFRQGDSSWAVSNGNYYEKVKEEILQSAEKTYVVTDSYAAASEFFKEIPNIEIVRSSSAFEDFKLMLQAKKLYCAPSTFSWWAAHTLPENCSVVAPKFLDDLLGFYTRCQLKAIG